MENRAPQRQVLLGALLFAVLVLYVAFALMHGWLAGEPGCRSYGVPWLC